MNCTETLQNLNLLLDGELSSSKEDAILKHLGECWHCKEVRENEEKLKILIKEKLVYNKTVPTHLSESIMAIIK